MPDKKTTTKNGDAVRPTPAGVLETLDEKQREGREAMASLDSSLADAIGFTHFDTGSSEDNLTTVLLARTDIPRIASQNLVRIRSAEDKRTYLGVIVAGPFYEPDAVPPSSTMAISATVAGKKLSYTFDYHARMNVEILGEEVNGRLHPPRYRPRPKSAVFVLDEEETAKILGIDQGDIRLGLVIGNESLEAKFSSSNKSVLPRHTGILGTTGGGKSTTVAGLVHQAEAAGMATILIDVEGEYTHIDQATTHAEMISALARRGMKPAGVKDLRVYHLTGRETSNPKQKALTPFALRLETLSPWQLTEILDMTDAQQERFFRAYEIAKLLLVETKVTSSEAAFEVDEMERGIPGMTITHLIDVVTAVLFSISNKGSSNGKQGRPEPKPRAARKGSAAKLVSEESDDETEDSGQSRPYLQSSFKDVWPQLQGKIRAHDLPKNEPSWKAVAGRLWRLKKLGIFDPPGVKPIDHAAMLRPGCVSVIDLSDTDSPQINNLVIADVLRGVQEAQERRYREAQKAGKRPTPTLLVIEEAHEFLSESRIKKMPVLFEQVARIAKRGRKRWLGLVFVTQLPQHLPSEVLGLLNNVIVHRITDGAVISRLHRSVGSIDESMWRRVPRLATGQAVCSMTSFTRPLLVAIDPAPVQRLLVD